jgi:hypothetical protein
MARRLFALALTFTGAAAAAAGKDPPVLLTAAVERDPKLAVLAAQTSYILDAAARRGGRFELVDLAERLDPLGVKKRRTWHESAADASEQAKKSYDLLEYRDALGYIQRSVELYEQTNLAQTFRELSAALVFRVASRYFDGDEAGARAELERLLTVDPRAEFDPQRFPPDLRDTVDRVKEERKAAGRITLDLSTDPVPARAYVDGIYRGVTPLGVRGLSPGDHYVTLIAPGYTFYQEKIKVAPGTAHRVTLAQLPPGPTVAFMKKLAYGAPDGLSVVRALGRGVGAAQVAAAFVDYAGRDVRVALWRIEVSDGHLAAEAEVVAPETDPNFAAKLDRMFADAMAKDAPRGQKGEPVLVSRRNVLSRFAGEVGLDRNTGQAVALISTGALAAGWVLFGALAASSNASYRNTPQTDPRIVDGSLAGTGRGLALTADVMLGLTAVSGLVWAVLRYGWPWESAGREALPP